MQNVKPDYEPSIKIFLKRRTEQAPKPTARNAHASKKLTNSNSEDLLKISENEFHVKGSNVSETELEF